ncbi:MAG: DUF5320 domain-containing protein [Bacteroidales bacterium]
MPNYNRKGPENEGPRTGRQLGRSNPENKGLNDEEIARKNADQPKQQQGRGRKDGSGKEHTDKRHFNSVRPKRGKRGPNRKHHSDKDDNNANQGGRGKGTGRGRGRSRGRVAGRGSGRD